jgi:hypothetical protein
VRILVLSATWAQVGSPWGPRASLQAGFNSSRVLLIGGKTADGDSSEVWEFYSGELREKQHAKRGKPVISGSFGFVCGGLSQQLLVFAMITARRRLEASPRQRAVWGKTCWHCSCV